MADVASVELSPQSLPVDFRNFWVYSAVRTCSLKKSIRDFTKFKISYYSKLKSRVIYMNYSPTATAKVAFLHGLITR